MHKELIFFFSLLGAKATSGALPADIEANWARLYVIAQSHQVESLCAYGLLEGNYMMEQSVWDAFLSKMTACAAQDRRQEEMLRLFAEAMEKAGADYMPIKGAVLKGMYPYSDMRFMVDTDVLIRKEQYPVIAKAMEEAGFVFEKESDHEYVYTKDGMSIELHKSLVPSYDTALSAYYGDGWQFARQAGGHLYALGKEDTFVYLLSHFAKHYQEGGGGIKAVLDIWLFLKKEPDMAYCMAQFEKLGIKTFAENVMRLGHVWFDGTPSDEITEAMTQFVVESSSLGSAENAALAKRTYGGKKSLLETVFPKAKSLQYIYPALQKRPWLLPYYWGCRIFRVTFFGKEKRDGLKAENEVVTEEKLEAFRAHMEMVGLDTKQRVL